MKLEGTRGGVFELTPRSYQFANAEGWDANWLVVEARVSTQRGTWSFTDACLTAGEARSLASWFAHVTNPHADLERFEFIEPVLSFDVVERGDLIVVRVYFELEGRPRWAIDEGWEEFYVDLGLRGDALSAASHEFSRELEPFPTR